MAESSVGDITSRLTIDTRQWQQGLQQALTQLQQFARTIQQMTQQMQQFGAAFQQATQQQQQAMTGLRNATQGTQQTFQQLNQQLNVTQQSFTQNISVVNNFNTTLNQTNTTLHTVTNSLQGAQHGASGLGSAWQNMLQIAGGIGIATSIQGIVSAFKQLAVETVQVGARFQQIQLSLNAIAGGAANGARQFEFLMRTAQDLGVPIESLASGWRQFTAAASQTTLTLTDQQRLFRALVNEGRRVGATNDEIGRAITALAQIASKGVVSMEDFRQQLAEAIPTASAAAARGMGRAKEELEELIGTGTVRAVPFFQALTRGFEQVGSGSTQMADSATSAFNRMMNQFKLLATAIMDSGLSGYLKTVAENFAEAARFVREGLFPQPYTAPVGPNVSEMGLDDANRRQLMRLDASIARVREQIALHEKTGMTERLELARRTLEVLEAQRTQIMEAAQAGQAQADAQKKVTDETNKTEQARAEQAAHLESVRKGLEDIRKAQENFRKEAANFPAMMGSPTGTAEQVETWRKGMMQATEAASKPLAELLRKAPAGFVMPPEEAAKIREINQLYGGLQTAIDGAKEAERERARAAREAEAQAKQAISQEIQLTAQLERVRAFMARTDATAAEIARTRVQAQGAEIQRTIDQAIRQFQESAALRQRAPGLLEEFQRLKEQLPAIIETQALDAFNAAVAQTSDRITQLSNSLTQMVGKLDLAGLDPMQAEFARIGRDFADLSTQLRRTREEFGKQWLEATTEEQFQQIREEVERLDAALGRLPYRLGAALTAAREAPGEAALRRMRDRLEQMQAPRGGEAFPWEESREEVKLRQQAAAANLTESQQAQFDELRKQVQAQRQLNYNLEIYYDLAGAVGNAWTQALSNIADGTTKVGEAFKSMAKSIMQSIAQLASQRAFDILIRIGAGLLTAAFTGGSNALGGTVGFGAAGGSGGGGFIAGLGLQGGPGISTGAYQGGGVITKPTLAYIGENPSTNPEIILNKPQFNALVNSAMQAGGGGQAGGVTVINYTAENRERAEQTAARERAFQKQVILNEVLSDLGQGEGSRIGRVMRTLSR